MSAYYTPLTLHQAVEQSLDYLRRDVGGQVRITGSDGSDYILTARRWTSPGLTPNRTRFFLDGDRASVDTIIGVVAYGCDTLLSGGRVVLRAPTLRAAIAAATGEQT